MDSVKTSKFEGKQSTGSSQTSSEEEATPESVSLKAPEEVEATPPPEEGTPAMQAELLTGILL